MICCFITFGKGIWFQAVTAVLTTIRQEGHAAAIANYAAVLSELRPPRGAVTTMKAPPLADDVKIEVKRFHDRISALAAAGTRHPVNFDDVWTLAGYSRKDSAKRALKGPGIDGEISLHTPVEPNKSTPHNKETILMTVRGFKHFCLMAPGKRGAQIRDYYISLEHIAYAAIDVAQGVANGDVTVTATTDAGGKRLRKFEDTLAITTKKLRSFETQRDDDVAQVNHYNNMARRRADERDAVILQARREAEADIAEYYEARDEHIEHAMLMHEEQQRLQKRRDSIVAQHTQLKNELDSADADFAALQRQLVDEMQARQRAWVMEQQANGRVLSSAMESVLE